MEFQRQEQFQNYNNYNLLMEREHDSYKKFDSMSDIRIDDKPDDDKSLASIKNESFACMANNIEIKLDNEASFNNNNNNSNNNNNNNSSNLMEPKSSKNLFCFLFCYGFKDNLISNE